MNSQVWSQSLILKSHSNSHLYLARTSLMASVLTRPHIGITGSFSLNKKSLGPTPKGSDLLGHICCLMCPQGVLTCSDSQGAVPGTAASASSGGLLAVKALSPPQ